VLSAGWRHANGGEVGGMVTELEQAPAPPGDRCGLPEDAVLDRLRAGDEEEFGRILSAWSPAMLHVALRFVRSRAAAEDVVQDTWLAVLAGLPAFEGRSSVRTWTFAILMNRARTHAGRDRRTLPWSELGGDEDGPTVDPTRFQGPGDPFPGHWTAAGTPRRWAAQPESASLAAEARTEIARALTGLPDRQRAVVTLRDVTGLSSGEACELLGISAQNQRVLLHRGRARLRAALEDYYRA
jgi:RNA polymerase sigma-70 factor (ECF subfamily)